MISYLVKKISNSFEIKKVIGSISFFLKSILIENVRGSKFNLLITTSVITWHNGYRRTRCLVVNPLSLNQLRATLTKVQEMPLLVNNPFIIDAFHFVPNKKHSQRTKYNNKMNRTSFCQTMNHEMHWNKPILCHRSKPHFI